MYDYVSPKSNTDMKRLFHCDLTLKHNGDYEQEYFNNIITFRSFFIKNVYCYFNHGDQQILITVVSEVKWGMFNTVAESTKDPTDECSCLYYLYSCRLNPAVFHLELWKTGMLCTESNQPSIYFLHLPGKKYCLWESHREGNTEVDKYDWLLTDKEHEHVSQRRFLVSVDTQTVGNKQSGPERNHKLYITKILYPKGQSWRNPVEAYLWRLISGLALIPSQSTETLKTSISFIIIYHFDRDSTGSHTSQGM